MGNTCRSVHHQPSITKHHHSSRRRRRQVQLDYNSDWPQVNYVRDKVLFNEDNLASTPCTRLENQLVMTSSGLEVNVTIIAPRTNTHNRAYMIERDIRQAQFGLVYVARELRRIENPSHDILWEATDKLRAIKEMSLARITKAVGAAERPVQELLAMMSLKKLHEDKIINQAKKEGRTLPLSPDELREKYEATMFDTNVMMTLDLLTDQDTIYCVMPFCKGQDLIDVLGDGNLDEDKARELMKQILNGIRTLQQAEICHRDISMENIVVDIVDGDRRAIICDFGMCSKIPYIQRENKSVRQRCSIRRNGTYGKALYMAPEVLFGHDYDGHAVDLWAVGIILFMVVSGGSPWMDNYKHNKVFRSCASGNLRLVVPHWKRNNPKFHLSEDLIDLLQRMFLFKPEERLSLEQIQGHPWMQA